MTSLHRRVGILAVALLSLILVALPSVHFAAGAWDPAAQAGNEPAAAQGPSQTTALKVSVIDRPVYAQGSDGKIHLEYTLVATSVFPNAITLSRLEVRSGEGSELLTLEGDALAAETQPLGDTGPLTREIPPSGSVATLVDVVLPPGKVPQRITNRVTYQLAADTPAILKALIGSLVIEGPSLTVDRRSQPMVIAPPLSGDGWFNANGCCAPTPHRSFRIAVDGLRFVTPETFAIDWIKMQGNRVFEGNGSTNQQYFAFGAEVRSATNGEVVSVVDGRPEETPRDDPAHVQLPNDVGGNGVVVKVQPGVYASYVHLQPGSIEVRVGDRVKTGRQLGKLGNTGNSTAPHLHFQLSDGPDILTSNSLPFVIDRYTLVGTVAPDSTDTDIRITGAPQPQEKTHPLFLSVSDFR